jgi:outer membrane protein TolC
VPNIQQAKRSRELALKNWRNELQLLNTLRERSVEGSPELEKQRRRVDEARVQYDTANEQYLDRIGGQNVESNGHRTAP